MFDLESFRQKWQILGAFFLISTLVFFCDVTTTNADEFQLCNEFSSSCANCLENGCSWVQDLGNCVESCPNDNPADDPCFSVEDFPDSSEIEICDIMAAAEVVSELICSVPTDCAACTSTIMSDGETTCYWDLRERICNSIRGESSCPIDSCESCLDAGGGWSFWNVQECLGSCSEIADADCYSPENFPDRTNLEICDIERRNRVDAQICANQSVCGACTATTTSDGNSTCYWLEEQSFCSNTMCSRIGCGTSICPLEAFMCASHSDCNSCTSAVMLDGTNSCYWNAEYSFCSNEQRGTSGCEESSYPDEAPACESCLESGRAWAVGECLSSCEVADVTCYSRVSFPNSSNEQICETERTHAVNAATCSEQFTCVDCTATMMSDGVTTCYWFAEQEVCSNTECGTAGCGAATCNVNTGWDERSAGNVTSSKSLLCIIYLAAAQMLMTHVAVTMFHGYWNFRVTVLFAFLFVFCCCCCYGH